MITIVSKSNYRIIYKTTCKTLYYYEELGTAYKAMAKDMKAEEQANEWVEALIDN
ncbi:MAG: hypothetical protein ACRYE8_00950 [Janthinobacterium lividum]